jgi:cytoskeletal protein RodZ
MTRTDVMASSRPHTTRMSIDRPGVLRRLAVVPAVLLVAMALVGPSTAFAAETSPYSQEPNKPSTSTTPTTTTPTATTPATSTPTTTTPATETSPSKESTTPTATETSPTKGSTTPEPAKSAKSGTLPFTGFDLRWSIGMGLLLLGAGVSLITLQRRRGDARR